MPPVSPIGIFTTDINMNITSWNDWLEKSTGLSEESVRNVHLTRVIPDIEKRGLLDRFLKVLTSGNVEILAPLFHNYLLKIPIDQTGNFTEMQQRITIAPLFDEEMIMGTLVTVEDMTRQLSGESSGIPLDKKLDDLSSENWLKRRDVAESLATAGKTIMSEVLRKIRLEHENMSILSSAMGVIAMSDENVNGYLIEFLNDRDNELRIYAAQMLAGKNDPEVIEALIRALDDSDPNVRYHAIEALGKLRAVRAVDRLAEIALSRDFFVSFPAVDALKQTGDNRASLLIAPLMEDDLLGQPVVEAMGELGEAEIIPQMVNLINENSRFIPWLVTSLARIAERYQETLGEGSYIAAVARKNFSANGVKHLLEYLENIKDNPELKNAVTVLGWIDDDSISRALTRFLGNTDIRKQVINALVASGPRVIDLLVSQLGADKEARQAAIMALGRIGDEKAADALLPLLGDDDVAVICCGAIAKIGSRKAFDDLLKLLGHDNPSIRRAAIAALNSISHPDMEKRLILLFSDKNPHIRESAVKIAGYFGYAGCKTFVHKLCSDIDINVRIAAIENLPAYEDERLYSALQCLFPDEDSRIRAAVVRAFGQIESKQSFNILTRALDDTEQWVRYFAVKSLDAHGFVEAIQKMKEIAIGDPAPFVRLAAIEFLGHTGGQLAASILSSLAGDPNRDVAIAAINAMGDIHHPEALPPLLALSKTTDPELRKNAIEAIGRRDGPGAASALQWVAMTDKVDAIRMSAINGLRQIANNESIAALLNLTTDNENRERAISALAGLPSEMMQVICNGLSHRNTLVRTAVVEVLLRMHSPLASAKLAGCLKHNDVNVRLATIRALHRLGNKSFMKSLMEMKYTDPDPVIRKAIEDLISVKSPGI
jgi:HEAT repeat protein